MRTLRVNFAALIGLCSLYVVSLLFGCASQGTQPESEQAGQPPLTAISSVFTSETSDTVNVTISADAPLTFSSLKQPDPLAVVLYFPETTVEEAQVVQPAMTDLISNIVTRQSNGQRTARVEIQLKGDTAYTAVQEGNSVLVSFNRPAEGAEQARLMSEDESEDASAAEETSAMGASQQADAGSAIQGGAQASQIAQEPAQYSSSVAAAAEKSPPVQISDSQTTAWVNKVDFVGENDGKSTLMVGTTHAVDYRINKVSPQRIEIQLLNTKIPSYHQRPLITTRFNSAVDRVTPVQPNTSKSESLITIDLRESVPYFTEQTDNMLFVHFEASHIPPKPLAQSNLPPWKRVLSGTDEGGVEVLSSAGTVAPATMPAYATETAMPGTSSDVQMAAAGPSVFADEEEQINAIMGKRTQSFTGEKIALDFFETDIKNVFRILREVSGKNFAIDKDVTGQVTMTMDKPVPWDQVLDLVLRMNQLGMVEEGDIVRIATLETIKREEDNRKARLEAYRKAREEVKALEPLVTRYLPVSYSDANSEVMPHITNILTKRGTVSVDSKNNQIIVTDTSKVVKRAAEIVKRIDKVTSQVVIEGRVVEVTENFSRELGIEWGTDYGPGVSNGLQIATDMAMNFPSQAASSIGINFSRLSGVPFVLNARLNAVETTGEGRILSSPKILTLDNKKAKIKQGVEYPYLERDSSGGSSVKFKNIDLLLEVTPHVTPDNRISMTIYITKNDVAGITAGVPSVATNEAETELLVNDGDTIVIGGIIKATEAVGQDGFPLLSKIPVIGWAFKNKSTKQQSNELLIFITPRIVQLEQVSIN